MVIDTNSSNNSNSNQTTDTAIAQEQIELMTHQFRAACRGVLNNGQPLDVEALVRVILRTTGWDRQRQQQVFASTKDGEANTTDATCSIQDGVAPLNSQTATSTADSAERPVFQGATLDFASSPVDLNATQNSPTQPASTPSQTDGQATTSGGAPQSIAGYEIVGELGQGGMGIIYKARQLVPRRFVALKMIRRDQATAGELARIRIEAEVIAQLQHPNIVQVYAFGEDAGRPYLALEYIEGGSIKDKLGGKPQPVLAAAQLVQTLALAMSVAHRQGIIHRDLKPANVMLMARREGSTSQRNDTTAVVEDLYGTPKIADFGLAKRLEVDDGQTRTGAILGTPKYMAPEQAMGRVKEVGALADQYALGAMLYEMLTGRPPLEGATVLETLEQVRTLEPVPPSRLQPKLPRDLETICLKCLQKEPQKRYADCAALAEDLRRFVTGEPILARPVSTPERIWRWCRRNPRVAGLSASLVLLMVSFLAVSMVFNVKLTEEKAQTEHEKDIAVNAQRLAEVKEQEALDQRLVALDTLGDLVTNVQAEIKKLRGQQELQKRLLKVAMDSLKRVSDNPKAKISLKDSTLAAAHYALGSIYVELAELGLADEEYRLAESAYAAQASADPDNPKCRANQALALMALGRVNLNRPGHIQEVPAFFGKAFDLLSTVDQGRPVDQLSPRNIKELRADAVQLLGVIAMGTRPRQARDYYQQCANLREEAADLTRIEVVQITGISSVGLMAASQGQGPLLTLVAPLVLQRNIDVAQLKLADAYLHLGGAERNLHNWPATQALYQKALELSQAMAQAHPEDLGYQWTLAKARERLGDFYLRSKRPELAGKEFAVAVQISQELVSRDKTNVRLKEELAVILYSVATAALCRGETELAAAKYRDSRDIRQVLTRGAKEGGIYEDYLVTLARCGECDLAASLARSLREKSSKEMNSLINVACCFAICSQATTASQRDDLADRALEALRTAVALGYRDVYNIETEPDLDGVRDRPGFKAILDELQRSEAK